jgi:hypothetical protein
MLRNLKRRADRSNWHALTSMLTTGGPEHFNRYVRFPTYILKDPEPYIVQVLVHRV